MKKSIKTNYLMRIITGFLLISLLSLTAYALAPSTNTHETESNIRYFPTDYQFLIYLSRYARWNEKEGRREKWNETVGRYFDFFVKHLENNQGYTLEPKERDDLEKAILNLKIMPSMRSLLTAGEALEKSNITCFECSYNTADDKRIFDESLYILLHGTGAGFSVERKYINKLPNRPGKYRKPKNAKIVVEDTREGFQKAYKELIEYLYKGIIPTWDTSKVRPRGTPLKTFGGRAIGPEPLEDLFEYTIETFTRKGKISRWDFKKYGLDHEVIMSKLLESKIISKDGIINPKKYKLKRDFKKWYTDYRYNKMISEMKAKKARENKENHIRRNGLGYIKRGEYEKARDLINKLQEGSIPNFEKNYHLAFKLKRRLEIKIYIEKYQVNTPFYPDFAEILRLINEEKISEAQTKIIEMKKIKNEKLPVVVLMKLQSELNEVKANKELSIKRKKIDESAIENQFKKVSDELNKIQIPLQQAFNRTKQRLKSRSKKLKSSEVAGIMCKIADSIGGRAALMCLYDQDDKDMKSFKSGNWRDENPHFERTNISYTLNKIPKDKTKILEDFDRSLGLVNGKRIKGSLGSGEPGMFNRAATIDHIKQYGRRKIQDFGINPCGEVVIPPQGFCNLAEIVVRPDDTPETLKEKAKQAAIVATWQSTLTNFHNIREKWKKNAIEERLIAVSLTGIMDHPVLSNYKDEQLPKLLKEMKQVVIDTNKEWAEKLGINSAAAVTCVKPSGTVSQLVDSSSGIHARHSPFYIRRVRGRKDDPLVEFLILSGVPHEDLENNPDEEVVFTFPIKSPENSVVTGDRTAVEQLDLWLIYQKHWAEHKPSITVYVKDEEVPEVKKWILKHLDEMTGVTFFPYSDIGYPQPPYEETTKDDIEGLKMLFPDIAWEHLSDIEKHDHTSGSGKIECSGSVCYKSFSVISENIDHSS